MDVGGPLYTRARSRTHTHIHTASRDERFHHHPYHNLSEATHHTLVLIHTTHRLLRDPRTIWLMPRDVLRQAKKIKKKIRNTHLVE